MADEITKKRITNYTTEVTFDALDNSDVIFVDSTQHGTRKLRLKGIRDIISGIQNEGIKSSGASVTADNYATTITNVNDQPVNTIYAYAAGLQSNIANLPSNVALNIMHYTYKYSIATNVGQVQIAIERSGENHAMYFRTTSGTPVSWSSWVKVANSTDLETSIHASINDLNTELGILDIFSDKDVKNGFINENGEYKSNNDWYIVYKIPVYGATQIRLIGWYSKLTVGSMNNAWAYDSNGDSLGGLYEQSSSGNIDATIDLPNGTTYISVCNTVSKRTSPGYVAYLIPKFNMLKRMIETLNDDLDKKMHKDVNRLMPLSTVYGKIIKIIDAIDNYYAVSIPSNSEIRSLNMYPINAINRDTNGISFTVDNNDNNTVSINGTATANAYSYGTITINNSIFLEAGTYYLKGFGSNNDDIRVYINIINATTNENSVKVKKISALINGWSFAIEEDSYVGCRLSIPKDATIQNETVSIMFSSFRIGKIHPYYPYFIPRKNGLLNNKCVIINENESDSVTYIRDSITINKPIRLKVATFNVGDYSGNGGNVGDVDEPTGDKSEYIRYISGLNADILCTQEDREYWKISTEESAFDEIYSNMYRQGALVSKAFSHGNTMAKAIYSWYDSVIEGKYTFINQGTYEPTGSKFWNSFTFAVLRIEMYDVLFVSVHLAPKSNNTEVRKSEITEMLSFIENLNVERVVICGDFNVWENEYEMFDDNWTLANCGVYGTYGTYDSENVHPYDNIIVSKGLTVSNVEVHDNNNFKDHYALSATVTIV